MKQLNWYQIFGKSNIPDGRTVEPTDDIQIWLNCANIWDKTYTTLAEVLADTDTLSALIASENAVDYMVRSTTWAVATALVPKMTSNNTPEGLCFASSVSGSYPIWRAFDRDDSTEWGPADANVPQYVGYKFTSAKCVKRVVIRPDASSSATPPGQSINAFSIQASNDNNTWDTLLTDSIPYENTPSNHAYNLTNDTEYLYYRLYISSKVWGWGTSVKTLQFTTEEGVCDNSTAMTYIGLNNYAANTLLADATWCEAIAKSEYFESVLNKKSPNMTSNTTPSGVCTANFAGGLVEGQAYNGFDGNTSTYTFYWSAVLANVLDGYIEYDFGTSIRIARIDIRNAKGTSSAGTITFYAEVYDSASGEWVAFGDSYGVSSTTADNVILDSKESSKVRFRVSSTFAVSGKYTWGEIVTCTIYGREDV